jgi:hypothetical protein
MDDSTWSTIKTLALTKEIDFRFGLSIDGKEEVDWLATPSWVTCRESVRRIGRSAVALRQSLCCWKVNRYRPKRKGPASAGPSRFMEGRSGRPSNRLIHRRFVYG